MASINGLTVKKIVEFRGHEGEPLVQCDVYYKGKKVGFYSQGDWGSESIARVDAAVREQFKEYGTRFLTEEEEKYAYAFKGIEWAIEDILVLHGQEKSFKKITKQGVYGGLVVVTTNIYAKSYAINYNMAKLSFDAIVEHLKSGTSELASIPNKNFSVYKSIEDFNITT